MKIVNTTRNDFDKIFRDEYPGLLRFAVSITDDEEASRDVVSDVFLNLWQNFDSVERTSVKSYLMVSVKNRCISHLRFVAKNNNFAEDYIKLCEEIYDDPSDALKKDQLVATMLDNLKDPTRGILTQCYLERKKYAEVAELRGISMSTVKKHITKALKILRELYAGKSIEEAMEMMNDK